MELGFSAALLASADSDQSTAIYHANDSNMNVNQHQWSCPICSMTFLTVFHLREHMRTHQGQSEDQPATLTSQKHDYRDRSKPHAAPSELVEHSTTPSQFCKMCGKSFWSAESADVHDCPHSNGTPTPFKSAKSQTCNVCGKTFRNASYFQLHMRMHAGDSTYSCDMCDKTFSCSWNLKTHLAVHKDDKPFVCALCGVGFKLKANMQRHERSHVLSKLPDATAPGDVFAEKKNYSCSTCGMRFNVKANVMRHERLHVNPSDGKQKSGEVRTDLSMVSKPVEAPVYKCLSAVVADRHACKVCGKTYKQRCHLLSHLLSHSDARPYVCEMCGKSFSLAWNLKTHLAVHNQEKPYSCTVCGSNFKLKTALQRHERSHVSVKMQARQFGSGGKSDASFKELQCPGCENKYLTFSELRSHMEVHSDPECFLCNRCGVDFSGLDDLRRHLDACKCIGKGFGCGVCNRKFSSALELQIHRQMHS